MSKAMQLVGIILLGIFTLVIINLMNDVRSTNELDYYLLQETVEASMYDAIDYSFYRETGLIKVDRDMFLESFNRRFAESVDSSNLREYKIKIIDFNETPPKASVEVTTVTAASVKGEGVSVVNRVDGIIETIYDDYVYSRGFYQMMVNPIDATKTTQIYNAQLVRKVEDAVGERFEYDATYGIVSKYDANCHSTHSPDCLHCNIGGWQGPDFCRAHGVNPTDDSCGNRVCDCQPGESEENNYCIKRGYTCPNGGTVNANNKCVKGGYTCPNGGTLDEANRKCITESYICPEGGELTPEHKCIKVLYTCPEGTVKQDGNVCVVSYDPRLN